MAKDRKTNDSQDVHELFSLKPPHNTKGNKDKNKNKNRDKKGGKSNK